MEKACSIFRPAGLETKICFCVFQKHGNLFSNLDPDENCRPDILLCNPHGGGKQIILDVAVTGINGNIR